MQDLPLLLVNENDEVIGTGEKMTVHQKGQLHRAFSIFIFTTAGELMLQQRADTKYHCPGLWSNTCCGHANEKETIEESAQRRLMEEMGLTTKLKKVGVIRYTAEVTDGLIENEMDHIFVGISNALPILNPEEVRAYKYGYLVTTHEDVLNTPELYTSWFYILMRDHIDKLLPNLAA